MATQYVLWETGLWADGLWGPELWETVAAAPEELRGRHGRKWRDFDKLLAKEAEERARQANTVQKALAAPASVDGMAKLRQALDAIRAPQIEIQRQQAAEMARLEAIAQDDDEEAAALAATLLLH